MGYDQSTIIDTEKCTGCGRCVAICPYNTLALENGKCHVVGEKSMHCGQCVAICPADAVIVLDLTTPSPTTIEDNPRARTLFELIQMRRSCRSYRTTPVDSAVLNDLVTFGLWAPTGTNSQKWTFTILPDRPSVEHFATGVADFYRNLNRKAANPLYRVFSWLFLKDVLGRYRRRYFKQVKESLDAWDNNKEDRLFHGATAVIIVGMRPGASCGPEDALLAAQNIGLGAEALGLGSCLIGFAVEAMKRDPKIACRVGISEEETVYAVIALGHPRYSWVRPSGRKPVIPRVFQI